LPSSKKTKKNKSQNIPENEQSSQNAKIPKKQRKKQKQKEKRLVQNIIKAGLEGKTLEIPQMPPLKKKKSTNNRQRINSMAGNVLPSKRKHRNWNKNKNAGVQKMPYKSRYTKSYFSRSISELKTPDGIAHYIGMETGKIARSNILPYIESTTDEIQENFHEFIEEEKKLLLDYERIQQQKILNSVFLIFL